MPVIFPDVEPTLVAYLQDALDTAYSDYDVHVATKKTQPDDDQPDVDVVINVAYNDVVNYVTQNASAIIEVFADDYALASNVARYVASVIVDCVDEDIKMAEVRFGPVRDLDESTQEKRNLDIALIVKGSSI